MPDAPVIEAPATTTTEAAPAPEQSGMSRFMQGMNDTAPAEAAPEPEKKPDKPSAEKPSEKAPEKQPEKAVKPAEAKPDPKSKAEAEPKDNNELRKVYYKERDLRQAKEKEAADLSKKIKELEGKKYYTDEDDKKVQAAENRIKELEQSLSESSYERSAEYQQKFAQPWKSARDGAEGMVEKMKVMADDQGNVRQGRKSDFWAIANLPVEEQSEAAQKLFGANALRVLTAIDKLSEIQQQEGIAVRNHQQGLEAKTKEQQHREEAEKKIYNENYASSREALKVEFPHFFGDDEGDPKIAEHMQKGYGFIDEVMAKVNSGNLSAADRAAYVAVIESRAAAADRLDYERNLYKSKWEASEAELAKYRKSDPGAGKDTSETTPTKGDDETPTGGAVALARNTKWE